MPLTLLIVPGKVFAPNELVTTEKLNQLGVPTIQVLTEDITFIVADSSITAAKLADGCLAATAEGRAKLADGFFTSGELAKFAAGFLAASADGRAKFADGFFTSAELAKFADGFLAATATGRGKMADGYLTVIKLAAGFLGDAALVAATPAKDDLLLFGDANDSNNSKKATISAVMGAVSAASGDYAMPGTGGQAGPWAHGLGATPRMLRGVLKCATTEHGYAVGDEIDLAHCWADNDNALGMLAANSAGVWFRRNDSGSIYAIHGSNGSTVTLTPASWVVKFYGSLY